MSCFKFSIIYRDSQTLCHVYCCRNCEAIHPSLHSQNKLSHHPLDAISFFWNFFKEWALSMSLVWPPSFFLHWSGTLAPYRPGFDSSCTDVTRLPLGDNIFLCNKHKTQIQDRVWSSKMTLESLRLNYPLVSNIRQPIIFQLSLSECVLTRLQSELQNVPDSKFICI